MERQNASLLAEKRSIGQPFKAYSNARSSDPDLPQVPKGWPIDAAVSFSSDCFHNRTTRKTANAIYNSLRMELISVLVGTPCALLFGHAADCITITTGRRELEACHGNA